MIETDDLIYRVDNHYLGPTGKTLPVPIRYSAVGVGLSTFFVLFVIARSVLHLSLSYGTFLILVVATVAVSSRITQYISADRPLRSVITAAYNDLTSPRPPKAGESIYITLPPPHRTRAAVGGHNHCAPTTNEATIR